MMKRYNEKIKLCCLLHAPHGGGAERFILHLLAGLNRDHFEIHLVLFSIEGPYKGDIPDDVKVHLLHWRYSSFLKRLPLFAWALSCIFRSIRPDIVFCTLTHMNTIALLAAKISGRGMPVVIREANMMVPYFSFSNLTNIKDDRQLMHKVLKRGDGGPMPIVGSDWLLDLRSWIYRTVYPWAAAFIVPAEAVMDSARQFLGDRVSLPRTYVIHNGVDHDKIGKKIMEEVCLPSYLSDKKMPVILAVGRFHYQKAFDVTLKAFALIRKSIPCRLVILGEGLKKRAKYETELKKLAVDLTIERDVEFLGFQSNPYAFMAKADLFLMTSRYEGFSNALLEAMACRLPCVVAAYHPSIKSFVVREGFGFSPEVDDVDGIAAAALRILTDHELRDRMSSMAWKVSLGFSVERMVYSYEDVFREVLGKSLGGLAGVNKRS